MDILYWDKWRSAVAVQGCGRQSLRRVESDHSYTGVVSRHSSQSLRQVNCKFLLIWLNLAHCLMHNLRCLCTVFDR